MLHVRQRALAGASRVAAYGRAGRVAGLEYKDADSAAVSLEVKKAFDDFAKTFADFQTKNDERLAQIEKKGGDAAAVDAVTTTELKKINDALDALKADVNKEVAALKRPQLELDAKGKPTTPEKAEYSKAFENYMRTGHGETKGSADFKALRDLELKALSIQSDTDGGFTVRPEMETAIDETVKLLSPIRDLSSVRTIGTDEYRKLVNVHGTASGWVGETQARPQTQGPQLKEVAFPVMELYAMPAATSRLLDDSFVNIDQWLADEVSLEFAQQEGIAFTTGDGNKKPWGFLAYPTIANANYVWEKVGYVFTGVSGDFHATLPGDNLVDLYYSLKAPYRANGTFAMNSATLAKTRKMKDGQGNYMINPSFANDGVVERIMGKPVAEVPDMPDPAANSLSVAFADFKRAYLIVDRFGIRVLRDPYTAKPYVLFYTTKRVGGGIQNFEAIKLLKFGTS